jgi:DNA-binding MarR family transcriptional regulator
MDERRRVYKITPKGKKELQEAKNFYKKTLERL